MREGTTGTFSFDGTLGIELSLLKTGHWTSLLGLGVYSGVGVDFATTSEHSLGLVCWVSEQGCEHRVPSTLIYTP